jgi:2-dehydropantoate 2-reductase
MLDKRIRITIVGAGAIGGVAAALLGRAGWELEVVCKHQETVDCIASRGLHLFGVKGEDYIQLRAVRTISDLSAGRRVILLATKATECVATAAELRPYLKDDAVVVSLQNGMCEDALAEVVGRNRVIGCVVGWGATHHGPGEIEITSSGEFVIGNIDHKPDERLASLQQLLHDVMPTRVTDNIKGELYSKLIVNAGINTLGVITGLNLGRILAIPKARNIFIALMREAMLVADAMGIKVAPGGGGKLDYDRFLSGKGRLADLKRHLVLRLIGFKNRRVRSSSLQSLERGRRTEIDYLNGYICSKGREFNVPTPLNDAVVAMVREIESGQRPIVPGNLKAPVFDRI